MSGVLRCKPDIEAELLEVGQMTQEVMQELRSFGQKPEMQSRTCGDVRETEGLEGSTRSLGKKSDDLGNVQRQDANRSLQAGLLELTRM